jgi:D-alanyl-D-alanine carboxypeptidase
MKRRTRSAASAGLAGAVVTALLASVAAQPAAAHPDTGPPLPPVDPVVMQQVIDDMLAESKVPGAMAEVVDARAGDIRLASGTANLQTGAPMRYDLAGRVGGSTQTFVAAATLQLAGEGRLRLDDTVEQYLPGLIPWGREITLRQLLDHTAGLADYLELPRFKDQNQFLNERWTRFTPEQLVGFAVDQGQVVPPGEWYFSFTDFVVVGMIIKKVTGRSAQAEVTDRIIRPLGLRHTFFPTTQKSIPFRHAHGYLHLEDGRYVDVTRLDPSLASTGRGMISTVPDLIKFWRALLTTNKVLSPAMRRQMLTFKQIDGPPPAPDVPDIKVAQGLGIIRIQHPCGTVSYGSHGAGMHGWDTTVHLSADGTRAAAGIVNQYIQDEVQGAVLVGFLTAAFCSTPE